MHPSRCAFTCTTRFLKAEPSLRRVPGKYHHTMHIRMGPAMRLSSKPLSCTILWMLRRPLDNALAGKCSSICERLVFTGAIQQPRQNGHAAVLSPQTWPTHRLYPVQNKDFATILYIAWCMDRNVPFTSKHACCTLSSWRETPGT